MKKYKIFFKTCEKMKEIKSSSIDMVVTSPPYWDLKDYESEDQIGFKENYSTYLDRMNTVWRECSRCLSENGVFIININTKSENSSLKLIPYDFINFLKEIDWDLKEIIYWHKSSAIPQVNNLGDHFEYFLVFSKKNYTCQPFDFNDYLIKPPKKTNMWNINKKFGSVGKKYMIHPAIFPVEFIDRLIQSFTEEGDLILDPFLGSGTSLIAAFRNKRKFFGYELNNEEYKRLIRDRLEENGIDQDEVGFY